jgi:hypothetical protein
VTVDATSWRVDAQLQWLWTWVTPDTTVQAILPGRGLAQAASVIGLDYPGVCRTTAGIRIATSRPRRIRRAWRLRCGAVARGCSITQATASS